MTSHIFDRSGIAALDDLSAPSARDLFRAMEVEQEAFDAHAGCLRSPDYKWPIDPLHTWSRCWEYPYVYHAIAVCMTRDQSGRQLLIADVGSGVTFFPFAVAKLGHRVVCTDIDPVCERDMAKTIAVVPCQPGAVEFRLCSTDRLPFADEECDGVYCISVIEHIKDPEPTVQEIFRVLRPGGFLCLTVDLDLRGSFEIGPDGYARLQSALRARFQLALPERSVHPRAMLTSNTGPYPLPPAPPLEGAKLWAQKFLGDYLGKEYEPVVSYLLGVEGTLWKKPSSTQQVEKP